MKLVFRILILTSLACCSYGQSSTKEIIDRFFVKYAADPVDAFNYAFLTNTYFDLKSESITTVNIRLKNTIDVCGKYKGFEVIAKKAVGQSLEIISCFLKYERQPIRLIFIFYKPVDKWQVQNLAFDTDFDKELEETIKFSHLTETK